MDFFCGSRTADFEAALRGFWSVRWANKDGCLNAFLLEALKKLVFFRLECGASKQTNNSLMKVVTQESGVVLSRHFTENVEMVADMCPKCYAEQNDIQIVGVNGVFLFQTMGKIKNSSKINIEKLERILKTLVEPEEIINIKASFTKSENKLVNYEDEHNLHQMIDAIKPPDTNSTVVTEINPKTRNCLKESEEYGEEGSAFELKGVVLKLPLEDFVDHKDENEEFLPQNLDSGIFSTDAIEESEELLHEDSAFERNESIFELPVLNLLNHVEENAKSQPQNLKNRTFGEDDSEESGYFAKEIEKNATFEVSKSINKGNEDLNHRIGQNCKDSTTNRAKRKEERKIGVILNKTMPSMDCNLKEIVHMKQQTFEAFENCGEDGVEESEDTKVEGQDYTFIFPVNDFLDNGDDIQKSQHQTFKNRTFHTEESGYFAEEIEEEATSEFPKRDFLSYKNKNEDLKHQISEYWKDSAEEIVKRKEEGEIEVILKKVRQEIICNLEEIVDMMQPTFKTTNSGKDCIEESEDTRIEEQDRTFILPVNDFLDHGDEIEESQHQKFKNKAFGEDHTEESRYFAEEIDEKATYEFSITDFLSCNNGNVDSKHKIRVNSEDSTDEIGERKEAGKIEVILNKIVLEKDFNVEEVANIKQSAFEITNSAEDRMEESKGTKDELHNDTFLHPPLNDFLDDGCEIEEFQRQNLEIGATGAHSKEESEDFAEETEEEIAFRQKRVVLDLLNRNFLVKGKENQDWMNQIEEMLEDSKEKVVKLEDFCGKYEENESSPCKISAKCSNLDAKFPKSEPRSYVFDIPQPMKTEEEIKVFPATGAPKEELQLKQNHYDGENPKQPSSSKTLTAIPTEELLPTTSLSKIHSNLARIKRSKLSWIPPRSPHNLIEESLYENPWSLLVATIFLNKTQCMYARPHLMKFLADHPTPESVLRKRPEDLEPYFETIGLRKRAEQVWRMSRDFLHKEWRSVRELYGIGKYGDDAYRMFCLGDLGVEPTDRFLRIYKAWFRLRGKGESDGGMEDVIEKKKETNVRFCN